MGYQVRQLTVNTFTRKVVDATKQYNPIEFAKALRLFYGEIIVLGVSFVDDNGSAITEYVSGDEFELSVDVDFIHVEYEGTLDSAYSGAVTSIAITFDSDPGTLSSSGYLTLRNDNDQRETVAYTAVSGSGVNRTFTVSTTLTYSYDSGDFAGVSDSLMVREDDSSVDIINDWDGVDRANGKISIRTDCGKFEFLRKLESEGLNNNNELAVFIEIKRKPSGESYWSVLLQDTIYARNVVRDIEE